MNRKNTQPSSDSFITSNPIQLTRSRIQSLLTNLQTKAQQCPGLYPVTLREEFFTLAAFDLNFFPNKSKNNSPFHLSSPPLSQLNSLSLEQLESLSLLLEKLWKHPDQISPLWTNALRHTGHTELKVAPASAQQAQIQQTKQRNSLFSNS